MLKDEIGEGKKKSNHIRTKGKKIAIKIMRIKIKIKK